MRLVETTEESTVAAAPAIAAARPAHVKLGQILLSRGKIEEAELERVLRLQAYISPTVHWIGEGSYAMEVSRNGNAYREHKDSIFENSGGLPDTRGLEYGDTDTRSTVQGKTGFVFNPLGPGVYVRPSLRLLYGVQYSNQNNAFGNSFVENIDQYNEFGNVERHLHHVVSLETEAWF